MTVCFSSKYFPLYTRELLECLLKVPSRISPSGRNPCGGGGGGGGCASIIPSKKDSRGVLGTSFRFGPTLPCKQRLHFRGMSWCLISRKCSLCSQGRPTSEIFSKTSREYGGSSVVKTDCQRSCFIRQRSVIYGIVDEVYVYCHCCRVLGPV